MKIKKLEIMIIEDYDNFGFKECRAGALSNVLNHQGVIAPHSDEPFTEAMLLGIGGGIGMEYLVFGMKSPKPQFFLRFVNFSEPRGEFFNSIDQKTNITCKIQQTSSRKKAYKTIIESLSEKKPVITYIRRPYFTLPKNWQPYGSWVVVYGIDEEADQAYLADWSNQPLSISIQELTEARASYAGAKHATVVVTSSKEIGELESAIKAGLRDCYQELVRPSAASALMGVQTFEKWAKRLADPKDKTGWPQLFSGLHLFDILAYVYAKIEFINTSGGAQRLAYADFLEEAADVLSSSELKEISSLYRSVAERWSNFARAALPDTIQLFKDARDAATKWKETFITEGLSDSLRLAEATEKFNTIRNQIGEWFPLSEKEVRMLFEDLSKRMYKIYEEEKKALERLKSVIS
ncbi:MAG: DUF4872 domain-containing protein [Candidatus Hermodarchaeota archaeon]